MAIVLNPIHVLNPFRIFQRDIQNSVLFGLRLVENVKKFPDPTPEEKKYIYVANGINSDINQSKSYFKQWLLRKGFEDICTYFHTTLERLYVYKNLENEIKKTSLINFDEILDVLSRQANGKNFPNLITAVSSLFGKPIELRSQIESINNARNCLVHRGGVVGKKDINNLLTNKLEITGERKKLFYKEGDKEIAVEFGKSSVVGSGVYLKIENFKFEFDFNDQIDLSLKQYLDLLDTCTGFNSDVVHLLNLE